MNELSTHYCRAVCINLALSIAKGDAKVTRFPYPSTLYRIEVLTHVVYIDTRTQNDDKGMSLLIGEPTRQQKVFHSPLVAEVVRIIQNPDEQALIAKSSAAVTHMYANVQVEVDGLKALVASTKEPEVGAMDFVQLSEPGETPQLHLMPKGVIDTMARFQMLADTAGLATAGDWQDLYRTLHDELNAWCREMHQEAMKNAPPIPQPTERDEMMASAFDKAIDDMPTIVVSGKDLTTYSFPTKADSEGMYDPDTDVVIQVELDETEGKLVQKVVAGPTCFDEQES